MSDAAGSLPERVGPVPDFGEQTAEETRLSVYRAILSGVPFPFLGAVASLLSDLPRARDAKMTAFLTQLADAVNSLSKEQKAKVETDEFAHLLTKALPSIASEYREDKIAAFRNVLVNSLAIDGPAYMKEGFVLLLERMTPLHLLVLHVFAGSRHKHGYRHPESHPMFSYFSGSTSDTVGRLKSHQMLRGEATPMIEPVFLELIGMGLIQEAITSGSNDWLSEANFPEQRRTDLTEYGSRFLTFVNNPDKEEARFEA